jgi:copper chaperone CopZ
MSRSSTAILHLQKSDPPPQQSLIEKVLRPLRGVSQVNVEPTESLVMIRFENALTNLADIVRTIEDGGSIVTSVAERQNGFRADARPNVRPAEPV